VTDWAEEKAKDIWFDIEQNSDEDPTLHIDEIALALREAMERQKKIDAEVANKVLLGIFADTGYVDNFQGEAATTIRNLILSQRDDTKERT
jgi:hypothetical protein